ncbi:hypothetical protein B0J18DRAFT_441204 [Chaetomium sp. MPI-SDFR-AT-0129]|nr:hypothetical protein B0J18DRAFT_441204 [Chaetomium sp. MPI-SDFR-AT-0129]
MTPSLPSFLNAGQYLDILLSDPAKNLINTFGASLQSSSSSSSSPPRSDGQPESPQDQDRLLIGLAALNAFLQGTVTGPVLEESKLQAVEGLFVKGWTVATGGDGSLEEKKGLLRRACLQSLEVDGVSVYEHVPMIEVFSLARWILVGRVSEAATGATTEGDGLLLEGGAATKSAKWLALRAHVWHYKLLMQPSLGPGAVFNKAGQWCDVPSLQDIVEKGLVEVEGEIVGDGSSQEGGGGRWSDEEKVQFLVESANVYILLGLDGKAKTALAKATELSGFVYALSGALGKRTRFQEKSTSQLVVLAKSRESGGESKATDGAKPEALALNDDTLLEDLEFTNEEVESDQKSDLPEVLQNLSPDEQPQLSPLDEIILLAEATLKDAFSPADTLTAEEVLPFAVRVIGDKKTNWQIYTHALLVRSRIELHRSRTLERGVLQMQAVVDQVIVDTTQPVEEPAETVNSDRDDGVPEITVTTDREETSKPANKPTSFFPAAKPTESAPAQVRLEHIHALSSPPRWHLESELAYSWASVGSLVSALEIFKRLRLWAEVALCYASNAAKDDEDGRGSGGEVKAKAIVRWRLFNKTGTSMDEAGGDEPDDNVDVDELREADYHGPERKSTPPNAPRLWCILGDLEDDPSHYERAWEISKHRFARAQKSLGEYYLQKKDIIKAKDAYEKAVAVNRLSSELWNRFGDINLRLGDFSAAANAYNRAITSSDSIGGGEDARTWSNLGSAFYSLYLERLKELKQQKESDTDTTDDAAVSPTIHNDEEDNDDITDKTTTPANRDPSALLAQSLAAYKRGANISHDNWRIWDNVITLAARLRPVPVSDLLLALHNIVRIRHTEDALDIDVLRLLLNEGVLSKEKENPKEGVPYEPPRGTPQRAVCEFLEKTVAPLVTKRSELWELVTRARVWRGDYAGAVDASEKAWRAAVGGVQAGSGSSLGGGLRDSAAAGAGESGGGTGNWLEEQEGWSVVVERTDGLVSMLENYGELVPEIGTKWKGKARSAVRSVMGKAKENWEGSEGWERLVGLLEGLKI